MSPNFSALTWTQGFYFACLFICPVTEFSLSLLTSIWDFPVTTLHLVLAPSLLVHSHMADHCWWCTVLWCMDFCGSFVWCRRAIDSAGGGGGWEEGVGSLGWVGRGMAPPPHGLLGEGVRARHWARGHHRGSQHIVLPSQPVCNLSHVCNGWWKKECKGKKGGGSGKKSS